MFTTGIVWGNETERSMESKVVRIKFRIILHSVVHKLITWWVGKTCSTVISNLRLPCYKFSTPFHVLKCVRSAMLASLTSVWLTQSMLGIYSKKRRNDISRMKPRVFYEYVVVHVFVVWHKHRKLWITWGEFVSIDKCSLTSMVLNFLGIVATWLILPVVIRSSQGLSHACLSINILLWNCEWLIISVIVYLIVPYYLDNRSNSRANTCINAWLLKGGIY